jgi:hypothetical protein
VAGFIYAVLGIVYAVLLGFAAITVWERYDRAQASVEQEADDLAELYRDAETFRVMFAHSSKVKSATTLGLQSRRSGQPWPTANQTPRFGMPTLGCGARIINFRLELIRKRLGTRSR